MNVWRLVIREIRARKLNFALGVASVTLAVGVLVAQLTLLKGHDAATEAILALKETQTRARMLQLEEDYRKITRHLGFNILILPEGQNLTDFYAEGYASKFMSEEYAKRLADAGIMSIQHLLPILEQKRDWPEQNRTIILVGTRGEVPQLQSDEKKPLLDPVGPGQMVVGYELARSLGLSPGQNVRLMGRSFTVRDCHAERGTKDDITVWINLAQAQELLDKKGLINAILALECRCAWADLAKVRAEVSAVLPGTQVKEFASSALTRAEARNRAAVEHAQALQAEKENRGRLRRQLEGLAAWAIPLVMVGCTAWVALVALANVRERRGEIGILRAIGVRSRLILMLFLSRAVLMGLVGAALGWACGFAVGATAGEAGHAGAAAVFIAPLLPAVVLAAPLLAALASWAPAWTAAGEDPAVILSQD